MTSTRVPDRVQGLLARFREGGLARNTGWAFVGEGARVAVQAVYFVLLTKRLNPDGYGAFSSVVALVAVLLPFSSWGWGSLLIKNTARDETRFADYWGQTLKVTVGTGFAFSFVASGIAYIVYGKTLHWSLPVLVAISDLFFYRLCTGASQAFQAHQRMGYSTLMQLLVTVFRLAAMLLMMAFTTWTSPQAWAGLYCVSTAAAAFAALWLVGQAYGRPSFSGELQRADALEGFHFSLSWSSQTIYNDIDKAMLGRLSTFYANGVYSAAYRVIDLSFFPIRSVMYAAYARFFKQGEAGVHAAVRLARRLLVPSVAYALVASIGLFLAAPLIDSLLGSQYVESVAAIRLLAAIPVLRAIGVFASDTLSGSGYQSWRSSLQFSIALMNVLLNFVLIPRYSWRGAAVASLVTDTAMSVGMWVLIAVAMRKERVASTIMGA